MIEAKILVLGFTSEGGGEGVGKVKKLTLQLIIGY
jgi:hypothetical protein